MQPEIEPKGIERYVGRDLISVEGEKLGTISEVIVHAVTEVPEWFLVSGGLLSGRALIVSGCR